MLGGGRVAGREWEGRGGMCMHTGESVFVRVCMHTGRARVCMCARMRGESLCACVHACMRGWVGGWVDGCCAESYDESGART